MAVTQLESARRATRKTAEERIARTEALLFAICCAANGDIKTGDPGNANTIGWLTHIAEDELRLLMDGLDAGAADLDCGT